MPESRRYTDEQVKEILERTLKQTADSGLSHEELVDVASEIGVPRDAVEAAVRDLEDGRSESDARARILAERRSGLTAHTIAFVGVNLLLFSIDYLFTRGIWWFVIPLLGWGIGYIFHLRAAVSKTVTRAEIEHEWAREERRASRRRRAAERISRREARFHHRDAPRKKQPERDAIDEGADAISKAVEDGVGAIMLKVAEGIRKKSGGYSQTRSDQRPSKGQEEDRARVAQDIGFPFKKGARSSSEEAERERAAEEELEEELRGKRSRRS